jgi:hypothetical protein
MILAIASTSHDRVSEHVWDKVGNDFVSQVVIVTVVVAAAVVLVPVLVAAIVIVPLLIRRKRNYRFLYLCCAVGSC